MIGLLINDLGSVGQATHPLAMALPAKVQAQLVDFDEQLSSFEESVKSLERECRGQKQAGLAPEEAAKFNLLMALKVNALYYGACARAGRRGRRV